MSETTGPQVQMTYVVEFTQTDPPGSPTPGCGHYAGEVTCPTRDEALAVAIAAICQPVSLHCFRPCCDWQDPATPVTGCLVLVRDCDDVTVASWQVRGRFES